jgi:hypothetical protein
MKKIYSRNLKDFTTFMKSVVDEECRLLALVGTDVSGNRIASIIKVTRIGEVGTTLAVTSS